MTPSEIVSLARDLAGARVDEVSDDQMFQYLNIEYRKLWQDISAIDKNYKLKERKTNVVQWVNSYELKVPVQTSPQETGQIKINSVFVKYQTTDEYACLLQERDRDDLEYDIQRYKDNYDRYSEWFYILSDNSIQIFPEPKFNVVDWLIVLANQRPYDLDDTMTEDDILIEREYHDVLARAIVPYVYQLRQQDDRSLWNFEQKYDVKKKKMLRQLKIRTIKPIKWYNANWSKYVYWGKYYYWKRNY